MKRKIISIIATLSILLLAYSVSAHDPKEHTKKPKKTNCAAMEKMRKDKQDKGEKLDITNPIVLAMMKKCNKNKKHADMSQHPDKEKQSQSGNDKTDPHH